MSGARGRIAVTAALLGVHAALATWAIRAWIDGPFHGAAILDGGEVLAIAQHGRAAVFDTKSPLYPWLLGGLLRAGASAPWTAGLFGLAASLATMLGIGALCRRVVVRDESAHDEPARAGRAAAWGMGLYALSGSSLVMLTQPLPALLATALLVWGTVAAFAAADSGAARRAAGGGALLGAAVLTLASLAPAAALAACAARRRWMFVIGGALLAGAAGLALFGGRAWPEGSGLNLRLGNSGLRSGTSDVRPGPVYDRLRLEPVFAAYDAGAARIDAEGFQRRALWREVAADPAGAAATLLRKLFLFWHRTEIVTDADFRYGLQPMTALPLLLLSYGIIAPLALAGLLLRRRSAAWRAALWLPVLGVLLANVVWLTSARYRFPALPFLCAAAGMFLAGRPRATGWALAGAFGLLMNLNLSGRELVWPGDGAAQAGREFMAQPGHELDALAPLQEAVAQGRDPRARYDLALLYEKLSDALGRKDLVLEAERNYRDALALDPLYPQAAENLLRLLIYAGRFDEEVSLGRQVVAENPYAGLARLNLASALARMDRPDDVRGLLIEGHRIAALVALAQNDLAGAQVHQLELERLAAPDEELSRLIRSASEGG